MKKILVTLIIFCLLPSTALAGQQDFLQITEEQKENLKIEIVKEYKRKTYTEKIIRFTYPTTKDRQFLNVEKHVVAKTGSKKGQFVHATTNSAGIMNGGDTVSIWLKEGELVLLKFYWQEYPEGEGFSEKVPLFQFTYTP